ncbi:MAG: FUSC family protein [Solirubrobacteraceae bacterium]|nr:FUSC family protein [Solirubrobacteraceae bacterium]
MDGQGRSDRAGALLTSARTRLSARMPLRRLRRSTLMIVQCALAAALAYLVAAHVADHGTPFFAPIAAVLTLSIAYGQRGRRAVELAVGVAVGIGVGDLIVLAIGTGFWQIGVVVALAMGAAVLVGGGRLLVNQAAVSGVLVATIQVPDGGFDATRFLDALIGGGVGLLVNALVPPDPMRIARRELDALVEELASTLEDVAAALRLRDRERAGAATARARAIDPLLARYEEALAVGREMLTLVPARRRGLRRLPAFERAAAGLDHAVRNTRVLARGAIRAVELDEHVPPLAIDAIGDLAAAVRAIGDGLDDPARAAAAEEAALYAAARSTAALEHTGNLSASFIVGQIRSMAVDLLRAMGTDGEEARSAVRDARARLKV